MVKILSDEVNKTQPQLLVALFQYVRWVVAAAKRRMFALGKGLVSVGLGSHLEKPYCDQSAPVLAIVRGREFVKP
jgi:hypothetical protein